MSTLGQIRDALKVRLETIPGLRVYDTVEGQISPPAAVIKIDTINYDTSMNSGSHDPTFSVFLFVPFSNDRTAQDKLDTYLDAESPTCVKVAIEGDPHLGGTVDFATVSMVRNYGLVTYAGVQYLGAELLVPTGIQ